MTTSPYVPGTEETDPKKQNMSLQALGGAISTNTTNIATNTTNIATNTASITTINTTLSQRGTSLTNSLGADVALNNTANYFDGPSVAQGTTGTWWASGTITCNSGSGAADTIFAKLWDGTSIIDSGSFHLTANGSTMTISLSGPITSPAGNIRISANDSSSALGKMLFNNTGVSKDSTVSAFRIL